MSEWWTYSLADTLMFTPRTYWRLFELHAQAWWPLAWVGAAGGVSLALAAGAQGLPPRAARARAAVWALLAVAWAWIGGSFHALRYASIHTAAPWFALGFGLQAVLLAGVAARVRAAGGGQAALPAGAPAPPVPRPARLTAAVLMAWAAAGQPALDLLLQRPQPQWLLLAPDPTVLATLGLLLAWPPPTRAGWRRWRPWMLPLLWCAVSGATLWTLGQPDALLLPAAGAVALVAAGLSPGPPAPAGRASRETPAS